MSVREDIQNDMQKNDFTSALNLCIKELRNNLYNPQGWSDLIRILLITGNGRLSCKTLDLVETLYPVNNIEAVVKSIYEQERYVENQQVQEFLRFAYTRLLVPVHGKHEKLSHQEKATICSTRRLDKLHYHDKIDRYINNLLLCETFPVFNKIEIETVNRCNNNCSFCPVNKNSDVRPYHKMSQELFEKIISELEEIHYSGHICLFSNNEPLLDERIVSLNKFVRKRLPNAYLYLDTNGTLITERVFLELVDVLDLLVIDNYSDGNMLIKPVKAIQSLCEKNDNFGGKVMISMRKQNEIKNSRGGLSKNRNAISTIRSKCILPFSQMIIRPDGKISLCCNDAYGTQTLGDASKESLLDVWNGERYWKIRNDLIYGRSRIEMCRKCDNFFIDSEVFRETGKH